MHRLTRNLACSSLNTQIQDMDVDNNFMSRWVCFTCTDVLVHRSRDPQPDGCRESGKQAMLRIGIYFFRDDVHTTFDTQPRSGNK